MENMENMENFNNFVKNALFRILTIEIQDSCSQENFYQKFKWNLGNANNFDEYIDSSIKYLMNVENSDDEDIIMLRTFIPLQRYFEQKQEMYKKDKSIILDDLHDYKKIMSMDEDYDEDELDVTTERQLYYII